MKKDAFSKYHPLIIFVFYIGAFVFGMIFLHPLFWGCSLCAAMLYYLTIRGKSGIRFILGMIPLYLGIMLMNPFFNTDGERILFTYMNGRVYTLEALLYGMAFASVMVTVLLWFASYQIVMTSDKFLYLFGKAFPTVSLIFTMIIRLLPDFKRKMKQITEARKGIGLLGEQGVTVLSVLTSWALEEGIVMADSMKSRGYGCTKRSSFSIYHFKKQDIRLLFIFAVLTAVIIFCGLHQGAAVTYTPKLRIMQNSYSFIGAAAYFLFLILPTVIDIAEDIRWYILKSRI